MNPYLEWALKFGLKNKDEFNLLKIRVASTDILYGKVDCYSCPIANAIRRAICDYYHLNYHEVCVRVCILSAPIILITHNNYLFECNLSNDSDQVYNFIRDYDSYKFVKPFDFSLNIKSKRNK